MDDNIEVFRMRDIMNGQPTEFVTQERYEEIIRLSKKGGKNGRQRQPSKS